ncbi:MAG: hypothetical protein RIE86_15670 [Imperialibacter sp.]|uniref:hypothetical protein n=1 Tax=Imperialibacter sp. TaxID=2038411 RepID=UPI0032EC64D1
MNIAFSTILIFLLLLPGLAFRRLYYTGEFSKEYFRSTTFEIFALGIIPSIILHVLGYNLLPQITPFSISLYFNLIEIPKISIDFRTIGLLLSGQGDYAFHKEVFENLGARLNSIALYFITTISAGAFFGVAFRIFIRRLKLDRRFKLLRFQNEWHYILSSEILDFPKVKRNGYYDNNGQEVEAVWIDALVDTDEGSILYTGIVEDYKLSKEGGLELLYLVNSYRRYLRDDEKSLSNKDLLEEEAEDGEFDATDGYYRLPDHYFILKYESILNLNVFYQFREKLKIDYQQIGIFILGLTLIGLIYYAFYKITNSFILALIGLAIVQFLLTRLSSKLGKKHDEPDEQDQ